MNQLKEKYKELDRLSYFKYMVALKKIYHRLKKANLNVNEFESIHLENTFKEYEIIKPIDNRDNKEGTPYLFLFEPKEVTINNYQKFIKNNPTAWKELFNYGVTIARNDLIDFLLFTDEEIIHLEDEIYHFNRQNIDEYSASNTIFQKFEIKLNKIKQLTVNSKTKTVEFIKKEMFQDHFDYTWNDLKDDLVLDFDYKKEIADFKTHSNIEMRLKFQGYLENLLKEYTMSNSESTDKVKFSNFNSFIKNLEYNYPYKTSVISFIYQGRDDLDYLCKEILDNLLTLSIEEKPIYLNRLEYEIKSLESYVFANIDNLKVWLVKYEISQEDLINNRLSDNELYKILNSDPPTFKETFEEDYNIDTDPIQKEFYNYYYGQSIQNALDFISDQQFKLNNPNQSENPVPKIRLNLTVPQLGYLFRSLFDEEILLTNNKMDLFKTIATTFQTTGKDDLSPKSIKNKFDIPEEAAAKFWHEKYLLLAQISKKAKEKSVD